ncbi:hypothetical protein ACFCYN_04575 [Gottfriedia sp. NPDC056225]|uniref:hypothetical protein n=1 Tax=Gottfriedia sp. NPDC056225 TaxID=3345751 RepID=UPI0035E10FB4
MFFINIIQFFRSYNGDKEAQQEAIGEMRPPGNGGTPGIGYIFIKGAKAVGKSVIYVAK